MKRKILKVMCGLPGSGKTTHINTHLIPEGYQVVCADDIRLAFGHRFHPDAEAMVHAVTETMVRALMKRGLNVVVDETNTTLGFVDILSDMATLYGYEIHLVRLCVPVEVCKARRDDGVFPLGVIDRMKANLDRNYEKLKAQVDHVFEFDEEGRVSWVK